MQFTGQNNGGTASSALHINMRNDMGEDTKFKHSIPKLPFCLFLSCAPQFEIHVIALAFYLIEDNLFNFIIVLPQGTVRYIQKVINTFLIYSCLSD